jgi:hypothetical protein
MDGHPENYLIQTVNTCYVYLKQDYFVKGGSDNAQSNNNIQ